MNSDSDRRIHRCEERGEKPVGGRQISRAKKSENERPSDCCEADDIPPPREKTDHEKGRDHLYSLFHRRPSASAPSCLRGLALFFGDDDAFDDLAGLQLAGRRIAPPWPCSTAQSSGCSRPFPGRS